MNRSEHLARFMEYGHELEVLERKEFFMVIMEENVQPEAVNRYSPFTSTDVMEFRVDGWKYCCYATTYSVGWQGDHDCDGFFFRIKESTKAESESMRAIFTRENDYTEWEGVIGDDDFKVL
jgi:hypothetical protein